MSELQALLIGFAFYLILEGVVPFFNPQGFKRLLAMSSQFSEQQIRRFGAVMIAIGLLLMFVIRSSG